MRDGAATERPRYRFRFSHGEAPWLGGELTRCYDGRVGEEIVDGPVLVTIGHGKRSVEGMVALLRRHDIAYVADVRSAPWSRYQPDFSHGALKRYLEEHGIVYLPMGEQLGGRPKEPECYDTEGKVDYEACRRRPAFRQGIERLLSARERGLRVALLCSESRPERCHRSKLIGEALAGEGIELLHFDEDDMVVSQRVVMDRLSGAQPTLFGPPVEAARSRNRVRRDE